MYWALVLLPSALPLPSNAMWTVCQVDAHAAPEVTSFTIPTHSLLPAAAQDTQLSSTSNMLAIVRPVQPWPCAVQRGSAQTHVQLR